MNLRTKLRRYGHNEAHVHGLHKGYQPKVQPKRLRHRGRKNKVDKTLYWSRKRRIGLAV